MVGTGRKPGFTSPAVGAANRRAGAATAAAFAARGGKNPGKTDKNGSPSKADAEYLALARRSQAAKVKHQEAKAKREAMAAQRESGDFVSRDNASQWMHHLYSMLRHEADQSLMYVEQLGISDETVKTYVIQIVRTVITNMRERMASTPSLLDWERE